MGNRLVDQRQLNMYKDQAARMQLGEQYQNQLAGWESQRGAGQQIGGVLGAIGGGLGGFFLGGPAGAMAGASAGYGMGSGIGGSMSGGPPRAPVYNSPYYGYETKADLFFQLRRAHPNLVGFKEFGGAASLRYAAEYIVGEDPGVSLLVGVDTQVFHGYVNCGAVGAVGAGAAGLCCSDEIAGVCIAEPGPLCC
jgi:hypothetical protein